MSKLAETLEELQRDILQGDLKDNPYLQGSTVPLLDKELKTKAKKIIPAINELLGMMDVFSAGISTFMDEVKGEVDGLKEEVQKMNTKLKGDFMELKNRVKLKKGESAVIGSVEELYDPGKQIKIYAYEENSKKYKFIDYEFKTETWGNSVRTFNVSPVEIQIDGESSEVVLVNRSSWELIIFIYR